MFFQMYKDTRGEWRWALIGGNGRVIADSAEGYRDKRDCRAGIELVREAAGVEVRDPEPAH